MMRLAWWGLPLMIAAPALSAQTLIDRVNGVQTDRAGRLMQFTGMVIGRDGKIVRLLRAGEARPARVTRRIDGRGRTLLPGLIDAHGHIMSLGAKAVQIDLQSATSIAEVQARLRAGAARLSPGEWLIGYGWNQEHWREGRMPTAADVDAAVADRPVWLSRIDGHAGVANGAAMQLAGVTAATPAPPGGKIVDGLFIDEAMGLIGRHIPAPSPAARAAALAAAQQALLAVGITAVGDMGIDRADWTLYRQAAQRGTLHVRIMAYGGGTDAALAIARGPTPWLHRDRLRLNVVKLFADGTLGSRGALLKAPYADDHGHGLAVTPLASLAQQAQRAVAVGLQPAIHAIGDAANAEVIGLYERLGQAGARRYRIEHLQVADPADLPRVARAGMIASMQPVHQTSDMMMAEKRLGPTRLKGAYAWRTLEQMGVRLAFGSDFPVESPNPFAGLAAAISRADAAGRPPGGWQPQERVSFATALHGFTRGAAYAGFAEGRFGALDPGHWADFILIDRDISRLDARDIGRTQVLETWLAGKRVYRR